VKRLTDWWFAPAPAERLAMLRIAIGTFALAWVGLRMSEIYAVAQLPTGFKPVGLVGILDEPLPPEVVLAIALATVVLLAAFTLGVAYRVVAPIAAIALTWTLCYRNSWGIPFHTENLLVLHVIALSIAPAADVWALGPRRTPPTPPAEAMEAKELFQFWFGGGVESVSQRAIARAASRRPGKITGHSSQGRLFLAGSSTRCPDAVLSWTNHTTAVRAPHQGTWCSAGR
jgi:hypothetical protein